MILRRLGARLKQQDWVAVAIEFAIVAAGVFLGIQASNWNDQRKERALEAAYLVRISHDVRSDISDLNEIIRVSEARMGLFNAMLPKASGQTLPTVFESARGRVATEPVPRYDAAKDASPAFTLFILTPLDDNRSAYETMIHTGVIANMGDIEALRRIEDYYAAVDRENHYELRLEENRDKFVNAELRVGLSPAKPATVDQFTAALAHNPELLAAAENYWLYTSRHLKLTRDLQAQARGLADYLDRRN
ncbi:MAG TPA: hypothetical protein VG407_08880 [Caulobacteraceae bacterium]|jgi:hypothetical protein|nr:hypothetical protein [Caulobacteraceae bacterium]